MIYVTQGHEKGIGLEVFLKSFTCLSKEYQDQFILIASRETLKQQMYQLDLKISLKDEFITINNSKLNILYTENTPLPATTQSLCLALERLQSTDILLTLPSSKDQFVFKGKIVNGHTEYFREYYHKSEIGMNFLADNTNILLLSDHIAIDEVTSYLSEELITRKLEQSIKALSGFRKLREVFFSGINPHCGEEGLISDSDQVLTKCINKLSQRYPHIRFNPMMSGDTLHFKMKDHEQLFVYAFHDQGLAPFKLKYGLTGINFTSGLPFKRVSVDHGTSFDLYGKNKANYLGMLFLLNEIEGWV